MRTTVLTMTLLAAITIAAGAATHIVDASGSEPGSFLTIQEGIDAAADGDTVLVLPGTYTGPGNTELDSGGTNIVLKSQDGQLATTIDCEGLYRAFYFENGESEDFVVDGFTFANGEAITYFPLGGAFYINSSQPTIRNCTFYNNSASGDTGRGGAIYCESSGNPTLVGVTFSNNTAGEKGGAIYCHLNSVPSVSSTTFSGNHARLGGAMYCEGVDPMLSDCEFSENTADYAGGAIYLTDCAPNLNGVDFIGNGSSGADGGGMYCSSSDPILTDCAFVDNVGYRGAGICCDLWSDPSLTDVSFVGNSGHIGGGLYSGNPTLTNVTFENNAATAAAGGMYCYGHPVINSATFIGNSASSGGAMKCNVFHWPISNVTFANNTATTGGAIDMEHSSPTITGNTMAGNSASITGAGINCVYDSNPTITNNIIAFSTSGEAVFADGDSHPSLTHNVIYENAGGDSLEANTDNLYQDPCFCNMEAEDYDYCEDSPCLPDNNAWMELIGAGEQGCPPCGSPVELSSWGGIKALFR